MELEKRSAMFTYNLPNGDDNIRVKLNAAGKVKFGTPLSWQVYDKTISILEDPRWSGNFKKIVDFGCGEMRLFKLLRRLSIVEHILNVDVDEGTLLLNKSRVEPLLTDNLQERDCPLRVEVLKGNICYAVKNLQNVDAAIVLEVIQQLLPDELEKMAENLFGFMQTKLVIMSTPGRQYNMIWNGLNENGLRSNEHKFEWSREEFKNWAKKICHKYKNYSLALLGVGPAPPEHAQLGFATYMAIFARNDINNRTLSSPIEENIPANESPELQYKQIYAIDFPFLKNQLTKEEKIIAEINSYLSYAWKCERFFNRERDIYQIPITHLLEYAIQINATNEDVLIALKTKNFVVENEFIILTQEYIDENYNVHGDDMNDEFYDDFLEFEPYRRDVDDCDDEGELSDTFKNDCSISDEENWD